MSSFLLGSSTPGAPVNPDDSFEDLGFAADGSLTTVTTGGAATKGSYATIGTLTNDCAGFFVHIGEPSSSANRYLLDVRINGATIVLPDAYIQAGNQSHPSIWVPWAGSAGQVIDARAQSNAAAATLKVAVSARIRTASHPTLFSNVRAITAVDATNSRASATDIAVSTSYAAPTYVQMIASTLEAYGHVLMVVGESGGAVTAQGGTAVLAQGAAASEVAIHRRPIKMAAASPFLIRGYSAMPKAVAGSVRLAAAVVAPTGGANVRAQLIGWY